MLVPTRIDVLKAVGLKLQEEQDEAILDASVVVRPAVSVAAADD